MCRTGLIITTKKNTQAMFIQLVECGVIDVCVCVPWLVDMGRSSESRAADRD